MAELIAGSLPAKVLHVLNGAVGGAALSTLGLIEQCEAYGIRACAVCDESGNRDERQRLLDATHGETVFMPLYWWNKKTRAPLWRRPLIELRQSLRTGRARRSAARVAELAARWDAQLVHTNTILTPEGGIASRLLGLPHVWHLREMIGPGQPFRLPLEGPRLGTYLATRCEKVIANSHASAACVQPWLPPGLLEIVPNGIDLAPFQIRAHQDSSRPLVIAMVGNLTTRWKKHALFVDAAALVDRSLNVEFRIYGHDPTQDGRLPGDPYVVDLRRRVAAAGLSERFRWPGHVADQAEIMSQIDVLVHPADGESFGRIVVEAMAAGLPVVGVRAGGVAEIVADGETGILVEPNCPESLASGIVRSRAIEHCGKRWAARGRKRAEGSYTLESCAKAVVRIYHGLVIRNEHGRRKRADQSTDAS